MLVTLTVLWWGVWSIAAAQYRNVMDRWIDEGRASGYHITYDEHRLFGFPRRVTLRFSNVQWTNTDAIEFHADTIDIAAWPWQWQAFDVKFKNRVQITAPIDDTGQALIVGGENGRAHVELDGDGIWKLSRVALTDAAVGRTPNYVFRAAKLNVAVERPDMPPQNHKQVGLTLTASGENITLPAEAASPFGLTMPLLTVALRVMDDVPDFRKKESVAAWNRDMGVVEFDDLQMEWGPLALKAKGTVGFDDDLQPEGAFASVIGGPEAVLKALGEHGFIAAGQQEMLSSSLSLFAKPANVTATKSGIEVPIAVQLGGFFLGPVKIFNFPEIRWPEQVSGARDQESGKL